MTGASVCELCQVVIPGGHRHVIDTEQCAVLCACPDCYDSSLWRKRGWSPGKPLAAGTSAAHGSRPLWQCDRSLPARGTSAPAAS